jgi:hypothetical protein
MRGVHYGRDFDNESSVERGPRIRVTGIAYSEAYCLPMIPANASIDICGMQFIPSFACADSIAGVMSYRVKPALCASSRNIFTVSIEYSAKS